MTLIFVVDSRLVSEEYEPANLRVSITGDQDGVYKDQVLGLSGEGPMNPTLLLIGKRLGHDNVNPLYYDSLKVSILSSYLRLGTPRTSPVRRNSRRTTIIFPLLLCLARRLSILPRSTSPSTCPPSARRPRILHYGRDRLLSHTSSSSNASKRNGYKYVNSLSRQRS